MELKEFVKTTIVEIAKGLKEAQEELENDDVIINPSLTTDSYISLTTGRRAIQKIEFNVGITIEDKTGSAKGIGVVASVFKAGVSSEASGLNQSVTNIKFEVPVSWPAYNLQKKSTVRSFGAY